MRCFIAIELSKEVKDVLQCIEDELQSLVRGVRWVPPENIHLTLKFLGSIEAATVEEVKKIADDAVKKFKPFKIRLSSLGAFPNPGRPRVIWVGIDEGTNECVELASMIDDRVSSLGIEKEERRFHPHLTLARIKFLKDKHSVQNAFSKTGVPPQEMEVKRVTLFQSELSSEGARYRALFSADLT
jgi:2'-5' RNA ligase